MLLGQEPVSDAVVQANEPAFRERGLFHHTSFSFLFGAGEDDPFGRYDEFGFYYESYGPNTGFNIQHVTGYQFHQMVNVGLGASYDVYNLDTGEQTLSLLGHYRGYLTKRGFAPFWGINAGYGFVLSNEVSGIVDGTGGLVLNPELGLHLGGQDDTSLTISLGYRVQTANYTREVPQVNIIEYRTVTYRRLMLSFGLLF